MHGINIHDNNSNRTRDISPLKQKSFSYQHQNYWKPGWMAFSVRQTSHSQRSDESLLEESIGGRCQVYSVLWGSCKPLIRCVITLRLSYAGFLLICLYSHEGDIFTDARGIPFMWQHLHEIWSRFFLSKTEHLVSPLARFATFGFWYDLFPLYWATVISR